MPDNHYISTEADRRAYEALQNIHRLHNYQQEREALERMKVNLSHTFMQRHVRSEIEHLSQCIQVGFFALNGGHSFDQAMAIAERELETLECTG